MSFDFPEGHPCNPCLPCAPLLPEAICGVAACEECAPCFSNDMTCSFGEEVIDSFESIMQGLDVQVFPGPRSLSFLPKYLCPLLSVWHSPTISSPSWWWCTVMVRRCEFVVAVWGVPPLLPSFSSSSSPPTSTSASPFPRNQFALRCSGGGPFLCRLG